jgi:hypothetical protein
MRCALLIVPLALAACGPAPETQFEPEGPVAGQTSNETSAALPARADSDSSIPEGSRPITAVGDLIGEYRVAGIDGAELPGNSGIGLSIDGPMLSYEPTCAGFVWNIVAQDGRFTFSRAPGYGPTRQADGSIMGCAVGVSPEQRRLGEAIDAVRTAWRTPSNGILLGGGGRSVLLFGQ